jgi:hypothetical protein
MIEVFHDYLSQLFWNGFADQLKKDDPARYIWEFTEFTKIYE